MRREGGQIPAPIRERIVFEINDRVVRLCDPALAQLAILLLLFGLVVPWHPTTDDGHNDVGLQLRNLQRRQRIDAIGAVQDLPVRMRLAHLPRHAVDEVPDVIRCETALLTLGRVFAGTQRALADGRVAIRRHHGNHADLVVIKLLPHIAHGFLEEFLIRVAEMVVRVRLEPPLAAILGKPIRVLRKHLRAVRHLSHPMRTLHVMGIAHAESHGPHGEVLAVHAKADIHPADREIRPHNLIDLRQRNRLHRRHHFAEFTRRIPAHAELLQKPAHGIEGTAFVIGPHLQRRELLAVLAFAVRQAGDTGHGEPLLVNRGIRDSPESTGDLVPLLLKRTVREIPVVPRPRFDRLELVVFAQQREPTGT